MGFNNLTVSRLRYINIGHVSYCDREASLFYVLNEIWIVAKMKEKKVGVVMVCYGLVTKGFITPAGFWPSGVNKK